MRTQVMTLILATCLLAACRTTTKIPQSKVDFPVKFDNTVALPEHQIDLSKWWEEWNDPALTILIKEGLSNNNSIKKAEQNIKVAKAYQTAVKADLWPMVGLAASSNHLNGNITSPDLVEEGINHIDSNLKVGQGGLLAKWDLDLFGQKQAQIQAAYYNLLTTQELLHASQMALSSRIAENYFDAITTQYQIQITEKVCSRLQQLLKYTIARFNAGQTTPNEVDKIKANLSQLDSQRELLNVQFDSIQRKIAVLTGHSPQGYRLKYNMQSLNRLPTIPTGVKPSDIVYRRPDLIARQRQISALAAKTSAAKTDLFPKFYVNFGLLGGKIGINVAKGSLSGPLLDVGVHLPIFTAGKIKANIKANEAMLQRALYDYDDALLNSLQEIDSAYQRRIAYDKSVAKLAESERIYLKRKEDSEKLFQHSEFTYDKVALNDLDYLKAQEETVRQRLQAARMTILLYQSLGGGWQYNEVEAK